MQTTLTFHGSAGIVTGSRTLVTDGNTRLLVDCGLFQGLKVDRERNWNPFTFNPENLSGVLLTHAHLDHSGALPLLVKKGFRGRIDCSEGTADLLEVLLLDAAHLQEEEAEFRNRHGYTKHRPALPLYTTADAEEALRLVRRRAYGEAFSIDGIECTFHKAEHIVGSSHVRLETASGSLLFSGDLGRGEHLLFGDLPPRPEADLIVCESTYGDRRHPSLSPTDELCETLRPVLQRRGTALIPAFAVGRAQELMVALEVLFRDGRLPRVPVYLDSPMAAKALEITRNALDDLSEDGRRLLEAATRHTTVIAGVAESKELNDKSGPMVIISASGMMVGGRILHHLVARAQNENDALILGGYQAVGTRGRTIADGADEVKIFGRPVSLRLEVSTLSTFSAHPDQEGILEWLAGAERPRTIIFNHGERSAVSGLVHAAESRFPGVECRAARLNATYALERRT